MTISLSRLIYFFYPLWYYVGITILYPSIHSFVYLFFSQWVIFHIRFDQKSTLFITSEGFHHVSDCANGKLIFKRRSRHPLFHTLVNQFKANVIPITHFTSLITSYYIFSPSCNTHQMNDVVIWHGADIGMPLIQINNQKNRLNSLANERQIVVIRKN